MRWARVVLWVALVVVPHPATAADPTPAATPATAPPGTPAAAPAAVSVPGETPVARRRIARPVPAPRYRLGFAVGTGGMWSSGNHVGTLFGRVDGALRVYEELRVTLGYGAQTRPWNPYLTWYSYADVGLSYRWRDRVEAGLGAGPVFVLLRKGPYQDSLTGIAGVVNLDATLWHGPDGLRLTVGGRAYPAWIAGRLYVGYTADLGFRWEM